MELTKLIDTINRTYLVSDLIRIPNAYYYMDQVIDDINDELQAKYPVFSDWADYVAAYNLLHADAPKSALVYDVIPDKYLRKVVALGTALYFYTADEEGEQIALDYQQKYNRALFHMIRDYHCQVPTEFQDTEGGYIDMTFEQESSDINPRGVTVDGVYTRIL